MSEKEKEKDKATIVERLILLVIRQAFGGIAKSAERFVKRALRWVAVVIAGIVIVVLGVAFIAVGAVKWFALIMPSWQAWVIVGAFLLLIGLVLSLATLVSSRG